MPQQNPTTTKTLYLREHCQRSRSLAGEENHLPSPLPEQFRRKQGILQTGVELPNKEQDQEGKSDDDRCDDSSTFPGVLATAEVQSNKEDGAAGNEEEQADVVHLADQLPSGLAVLSVFCGERGRMVEEEHEQAGTAVERTHVPVGTPPADAGAADEYIGDERRERGREGACAVQSCRGEDTSDCVLFWVQYLWFTYPTPSTDIYSG